MKVSFGTERAIIAGSLVLLLLLLFLFACNHPHSDDYSYTQIVGQKGFWRGSQDLFHNNTGRFLSTAIIFLSPLKAHSIAGYQWFTAGLFTCFVLSIFTLVYCLLNRFLGLRSILSLSAFLLLVFCSFAPKLHEFCFWLSGEATYLAAAVLWCWGIIIQVSLLREQQGSRVLPRVCALLHAVAICGVSESGLFLYAFLLVVVAVYRRKYHRAGNRFFYMISACFSLSAIVVLSAAGSQNRFGHTPFSGNLLLAIGGGLYASCYWLAQWLLILLPAVLLYLSVWGRRLLPWSALIGSYGMFRSKNVLFAGLSFFVFCQVLAVWMSGSMPEERYENVLFLFLLLLCCFAAQLFCYEQEAYFSRWTAIAEKRSRIAASVYCAAVFIAVPNNYGRALLDAGSGAAAAFHRENLQRYAELAGQTGDIVAVAPLSRQPALLYYPALSCDSSVDGQDIPRLALANYFGKKWIYEYPCSPEAKQYSLREILKQKRQEFFPEHSK